MPGACRCHGRVVVAGAVALSSLLDLAIAAPAVEVDRERHLQEIRGEIGRLRGELDALEEREQSVLGDLERLDAELRLRKAELGEVSFRLEGVVSEIERQDRAIEELSAAQEQRARYLGFRLREVYKRGPVSELRRFLGGQNLDVYMRGLGYASYLAERDARTLRDYRAGAERLQRARTELVQERTRLAATRTEADRARAALERSREERTRLLGRIRDDRHQREQALAELERASEGLNRLVRGLGEGSGGTALDIRKFRGLLDWPVKGTVTAGFGDRVHPRFKTVVPHPGLDIDAPEGAAFRSIFDGTVRYASWLHGYGLTVIVEHGNGLVSVYAHGSALLVEPGEHVIRGQSLGHVGDTASLQGPYLYFELLDGARPVDPRGWLRRSP